MEAFVHVQKDYTLKRGFYNTFIKYIYLRSQICQWSKWLNAINVLMLHEFTEFLILYNFPLFPQDWEGKKELMWDKSGDLSKNQTL